MHKLYRKVEKACELLGEARYTPVFTITDVEGVRTDYKTSNTPPTDGYAPFSRVEGLDERMWLKAGFKTPKAEEGFDYYLVVDTGIKSWNDAQNPQFILYLNGEMVQGLDINHRETKLSPDTEYEMYNYMYSGNQVGYFEIIHKVVKLHRDTEKLYYDMLVPFEACRDVYPENSEEHARTLSALDTVANALDLRAPRSAEFFASVSRALPLIEEVFYKKYCKTEGKPVVDCVGHTHIDVEWLWDRRQTREKIQRSASTALNLMKDYPEYTFMLSQPELYRYLKEEAPEKYAEVKEMVRCGRWEPEGAMYLECDCNLTGGESLVRQILFGKRFFREEFGKESRALFLPDVFGYSAALPQILTKSGVEYFVTSKISWNDTNTIPYDLFMWRGIDGTEIFSSFITGQGYSKDKFYRGATYVGTIDSSFIKGTWDRVQQKEYCTRALNTFGHGDGGGGPTKDMLEKQRRLSRGLPAMPVSNISFLIPYLEKVKAEFIENSTRLNRCPRWVGELYLEYHRGTYTSMAKNKLGNRRSEFALAATEALSATDLYFGGDYNSEGLFINWRDVLHNQFHDILPGSSVRSVYEFTEEDYKRVLAFTRAECEKKLSALAARVNTEGGTLVYNPLGFARSGEVKIGGKTVICENIPAFGYRVVRDTDAECKITVEDGVIDSPYYRIEYDRAGRFTSLFDKRAQREIVPRGMRLNEYQAFEDYPYMYDAWEMEEYMQTKQYTVDKDAAITPVYDGERAGIKVEHKYGSSTITETVWLHTGSPRIDLDNSIDWQDKHQILKLAFPIDINASEATFEIQFGHTKRPTHRNTSWDSAKFEVCAHKWVDMSENGYGVALLNDCKYGYSAEGNTLKLTCIKCPTYPNPTADEGEHSFLVSLLPHTGSLAEAGVIKEAYSINQPLMTKELGKQSGELGEEFSLLSVAEDAIIIEGIKKAEDNDDIIVRMYEAHGGRSGATLTLPEGTRRAYLTSLMENNERELEIRDGKLSLTLHAFEIATVRLAK